MNSLIRTISLGLWNLATGALLLAATPTSATTWTVCPAGCDANSIQVAIQLASAGDTIELMATGTHIEGDIIVNKSLLIRGLEQLDVTIAAAATRGTASSRVVTVLPGISVELRDLTLRFGNTVNGGAIFNQGSLLLTRTDLLQNDASGEGGGLFNDSGAMAVIRDSEIGENLAENLGGGASNHGDLQVVDSLFTLNDAGTSGGAVHSSEGTLLVERVLLVANRANVVSSAPAPGGGGVAATGGGVHIRDSMFYGNRSGNGGALYLTGSAAPVVLLQSTLYLNFANRGAGAYVRTELAPSFVNSSLISNYAAIDGGGIYVYGEKSLSLSSVTITENRANSDASGGGTGGGILLGAECGGTFCASTQVTLRNSLLAENVRLGGGGGTFPQDCLGDLTSAGYNLVGAGSTSPLAECEVEGNLTGTLLGVEAELGQVGFFGGPNLWDGDPPMTQSLLATSPAVDAGPPDGCRDPSGDLLPTDQRYAPRVGNCDLGAFEFNGVPTPPNPIFSDGFESGDTSNWSQ